MRILPFWIDLVTLDASFAEPAAAPVNQRSVERVKIPAGVSSIPKVGVPGAIATSGPHAFPVIAKGRGEGKAETVLVAAADLEKGRIVLFGRTLHFP